MERILKTFDFLGNLALPIMVIGLFFVYRPIFTEMPEETKEITFGLLIIGFGLSVIGFKNEHKTSKLESMLQKRPWLITAYLIILGSIMIAGVIVSLWFIYSLDSIEKRQVAIGIFSVCLGGFGVLRIIMSKAVDFRNNKKMKD